MVGLVRNVPYFPLSNLQHSAFVKRALKWSKSLFKEPEGVWATDRQGLTPSISVKAGSNYALNFQDQLGDQGRSKECAGEDCKGY
jgi:hypothetical protein